MGDHWSSLENPHSGMLTLSEQLMTAILTPPHSFSISCTLLDYTQVMQIKFFEPLPRKGSSLFDHSIKLRNSSLWKLIDKFIDFNGASFHEFLLSLSST